MQTPAAPDCRKKFGFVTRLRRAQNNGHFTEALSRAVQSVFCAISHSTPLGS